MFQLPPPPPCNVLILHGLYLRPRRAGPVWYREGWCRGNFHADEAKVAGTRRSSHDRVFGPVAYQLRQNPGIRRINLASREAVVAAVVRMVMDEVSGFTGKANGLAHFI